MTDVTAHIDQTPRGFQFVWMKRGNPVKYSKSYPTAEQAEKACRRALNAKAQEVSA